MDAAKKRLKDTLEWRREYKPDLIPPSEIKEETEGGKIIVTGFTFKGLPVIYLRPARENVRPPSRLNSLKKLTRRARPSHRRPKSGT